MQTEFNRHINQQVISSKFAGLELDTQQKKEPSIVCVYVQFVSWTN